MDSVIMSSPPPDQMCQGQNAKFAPIKSCPSGQQSNVAVHYSSDYSAKTSLDELFDLKKCQTHGQKPLRMRNLPGNFFNQSSASSSTSHSRDSLDSSHLNSPKRLSTAPSEMGSNHLSLKRSNKSKPLDPLSAFDSKTRSLPCSFSPSKFDPNMHPDTTPINLVPSNLSPNQLNKIQLESFTQLQRGLMCQSRANKSSGQSDVASLTEPTLSVLSNSNQIGAGLILNINSDPQCQVSPQVLQFNPSQVVVSNGLQQLPAMSMHTQQVIPSSHLASLHQMNCQPYSPNNLTMQHNHMSDPKPKEDNLRYLAQLQNERILMHKRQAELLQDGLIGRIRGIGVQSTAPSQQDNYGQFQYEPNVIKMQSRQESIDSGLDLVGSSYSSSADSTNRVSPDLSFMHQLPPNHQLVTVNSSGEAIPIQQYRVDNSQFGAAVTRKLITSPAQSRATVSASGLFGSKHNLVAATTATDNFDQLNLSSSRATLKSDLQSTPTGQSSFLCYPGTSTGPSLFEDYDSMSISSSPSTLDGSLACLNQAAESEPVSRLLLDSSAGQGNLSLNPSMHSPVSSMYEDNFLSSFLNNVDSTVDYFDFNGNFTGLSGHGAATDLSDLHGFSYNL